MPFLDLVVIGWVLVGTMAKDVGLGAGASVEDDV